MSFGTPAQRQLGQKFVGPFFNWPDDAKLREWLRQQDADELEQFLNWFDFTNHRDRETLGRQELQKLRSANLHSISNESAAKRPAEMITLKPGIWGMSVDLKELGHRLKRWLKKDDGR